MSSKITKLMAGAGLLAALPAGQAWAVGTASGTDVNNTFTLQYRVNGTGTPVTLANPGDGSHEANFKVDRMVDVLVEVQGTETKGGGIGDTVVHVFDVTNQGNATQAYGLTLANTSDNPATVESFNVLVANSTFEVTYNPDDPNPTWVTYALGDATNDIAPDVRMQIRVTTTIPAGLSLNDQAEFAISANTLETAADGNGDVTQSAGPNADGTVETVLRDAAGDVGGTGVTDAAEDGSHTDKAIVQVNAAADISATKSVALLNPDTTDATCAAIPATATPVATASAFYAPGACVEYTITVTNSGGSPATDIQIDDTLDADLVFISATTDITGGNFTGTNGKRPTAAGPCSTAAAGVIDANNPPATVDCEIIMVEGTLPGNGGSGSVSAVLKIRARVP